MGKIIAVTGAAGYLGRILLAQLQAQPWVERIIALDHRPIAADGRLISYSLNVRDIATLRAILGEHGVTHLVHAAFIITPPPGMSEQQAYQNNVEGSRHVLRIALELGVEQVLFISSVALYGYRPGQPVGVRENGDWQPNMVYGKQKAEVETFLNDQRKFFPKTRLTILRPTAIVGPLGRQLSHLRPMLAQPVFVLANGGKALTQALHEDDAAALIVKALEHNVAGTFNAAPNDSASWADIGKLSKLRLLSAPRAALNFVAQFHNIFPALHGFNREIVDYFSESLVVDNTAARQALNWMPRYGTLEAFGQLFGAEVPAHEKVRAEH